MNWINGPSTKQLIIQTHQIYVWASYNISSRELVYMEITDWLSRNSASWIFKAVLINPLSDFTFILQMSVSGHCERIIILFLNRKKLVCTFNSVWIAEKVIINQSFFFIFHDYNRSNSWGKKALIVKTCATPCGWWKAVFI